MWTPFPFSLFLPIIPIKNIPFKPSNPKKLNHMYNSLKADKGYSALVNQLGGKGSPRHFGTWYKPTHIYTLFCFFLHV